MEKLIIDMLFWYDEKNRFHMPGHFGKLNKENKILQDNLFKFDITEVNNADNLRSPEGIIKNSHNLLSKVYNSKKSYYLVNGSTAGVYIAIDSLLDFGDNILIEKNSHLSVHYICRRKNLKIFELDSGEDENFNIKKVVELSDIKYYVELANPKAVVLTYPSYFGSSCDIREIYRYLNSKGIYLILDSAHGAGFVFSDKLPQNPVNFCDICLCSLHKTLPAMTQVSSLHLGKNFPDSIIPKIEENMRFYQSTSPSYILLASAELAILNMLREGEERYEKLYSFFEKTKADFRQQGIFVYETKNFDFTKLYIKTPIDGEIFDFILRNSYKIQCEMVNGDDILFMLGTQSDEELEYLKNTVLKIAEEYKNFVSEKGFYLLEKYFIDNSKVSVKTINNKIDLHEFILQNNKFREHISENFLREYYKDAKDDFVESEHFFIRDYQEYIDRHIAKLKENDEINRAYLHQSDNLENEKANLLGKYSVIEIDIYNSLGKTLAKDVVAYPPGIVLAEKGDIVDKELIDRFVSYRIKTVFCIVKEYKDVKK